MGRSLERSGAMLLLLLASLVAALVSGHDLFYRLLYLFGGILALSFLWAWLNVHQVHLVRETRARRSQVGKPVEERIIVRNVGLLPKLWLEVRDHSTLPGHRVSRVVHSLGAHRHRSWTVKTICRQRGRFSLGPVTISSGDPLGLFLMSRQLPLTASLIVYPYTVELPGFAPPVGQLPGGDALRRRTHYVTTNVAGVREYAPGDSFNRIHWPSTAHANRLIAKEFELDPTADVWLFLDLERRVQAGEPRESAPELEGPALLWPDRLPIMELEPTTEEYGVAIAASLVRHFLERGRAVGFITYGERREVAQADRGERQLNRIMEILAVIRAEGRISLAQVLSSEGLPLTRHTTVVVVTPSAEVEWVAALCHLGSRGIRPIGVVIEAASFACTCGAGTGGGPLSVMGAVAELAAAQVPTFIVRCGEPLEVALSRGAVGTVRPPEAVPVGRSF
jgi:uncharacterized protein (DUF58 family)